MPTSSESLTLYGEEAERFRELRDDVLPESIGWTPSNAKAVAWLMAHIDEDALDE